MPFWTTSCSCLETLLRTRFEDALYLTPEGLDGELYDDMNFEDAPRKLKLFFSWILSRSFKFRDDLDSHFSELDDDFSKV